MMRRVASISGRIYVHRTLWYSVEFFLDEAERSERGAAHHLLGAALFAYLAFEAFLNDLGALIAPEAWRKEQAAFGRGSKDPGTLGKLRYLADLTGVPVDTEEAAYKLVEKLKDGRHRLAHPRRQTIADELEVASMDDVPPLRADIHSMAEPDFVYSAVGAVQELANRVHRAAVTRFAHPDIPPGDEAMRGISGGRESVIREEYT